MEEIKIFISYAHKDDAYFRLFKEGIESHSKSSKKIKWKIWCDKKISIGSLWHNVIQDEINTCDAAILLVSANFLCSDYIENEEFLNFLKRKEEDGFIFLPILLSDCDFTQWEKLSNRQFFYPQGLDFGLSRLTNISYSHLVTFNQEFVPIPNPYRETYHKKCVEAFENAIISQRNTQQDRLLKYNNSSLISALSNKDILNAINLFQGQIKERKMNEKELADAFDTKIKLYNTIFGDFDNQLDTIHKNNLANVVFDRIVFASEQIQKSDIDTIQNFRNNKIYKVRDRSIIVSGLTISLLNHFDSNKIHLLIDFLTDFEEEVWQRALVGLLFTLTRFNNRLSLFPEIETRLSELKEITDIQESICVIDRILRYRTFSSKELFLQNPDLFFSRIKILFGNSINFSREDLIELQTELYKLPNTTLEYKILNSLLKKETIEKLAQDLKNVESITITIEDFFNLFDFETYIGLYELNPLQFNLIDDIFKSSINWFTPFEDNEKIRELLINNFSVNDIDILDFISTMQKSSICDIDKHYIIAHIKDFSNDFIQILYSILLFDVSNSKNISTLELIMTKAIRDLYRFNKLSVICQNTNIFDDELSIYGQSLLEKIANNITQIKVNSQYLYDKGKYDESIINLQKIPNNKYDFEILNLFVNNYIALKQDENTLTYLNELLGFFENGIITINDIDKGSWYSKSKRIYERLEKKEPNKYRNTYRKYLEKEILIREKIFNETLGNELDLFKKDNVIDLADSYFDASLAYWNYDTNLVDCFLHIIKYLNVFFQIYSKNDVDRFLLEIRKRQKSITTVFQMISRKDEIDIIQLLDEKCDNIQKGLKVRVIDLFGVFKEINNKLPFVEIVKKNQSIQKHAKYLYEIMHPVIKQIDSDKYGVVEIPFILEKEEFNLSFSINDFLKEGFDLVVEKLSETIENNFLEEYVNLYLDNLFKEEEVPIFSMDILLKNIRRDFIKIDILGHNEDSVISIEKVRSLFVKGQYKTALSYVNKYLKSNPENEFAWNLKGNCLFFLKRSSNEIIRCYNKAIKLDGNFQLALENRANLLIKLERYQEALNDCEKALKIDPESDFAEELKKEALSGMGI